MTRMNVMNDRSRVYHMLRLPMIAHSELKSSRHTDTGSARIVVGRIDPKIAGETRGLRELREIARRSR